MEVRRIAAGEFWCLSSGRRPRKVVVALASPAYSPPPTRWKSSIRVAAQSNCPAADAAEPAVS